MAAIAAGLLGGGLIAFGGRRPWQAAGPGPGGDQVAGPGQLVVTLGAVILLGTLVVAVTRSMGRRLAGALVAAAGVVVAVITVTAQVGWSPWRIGVCVGAVLAAMAGGLSLVQGPRWAVMSQRYDAPGTRRTEADRDPWRALDRGEDPTL